MVADKWTEKTVVVILVVLVWAVVSVAGSIVLAACDDDQLGGYPTPLVREERR